MNMVSKVALGLALAIGTAGLATSPAIAKEKKKQEEKASWTPKLSKEFRAPIAAASDAVNKKDFATTATKLAEAEAVAKTPDEKYTLGSVRLQLATATSDKAMQRKALEEMVASGSGPADQLPRFAFYAGSLAYEAGDYPAAIQALTRAQQGGYVHTDAAGQPSRDLDLLLAESYIKAKQIPQGLAAVEHAIQAEKAAGKTPPDDWYARAASVAYQAKLPSEVAKWTRLQVESYPTAENWRSALVIYRDGTNLDNAANLDLLRLMRASKALTSERDYYEYADLAARGGLVGEAKSVIEEGRAAGVFGASNRAIGDIYTAVSAKVKEDQASLASAEKSAAGAANGRVALGTGDAYLGYGDYAKAAAMYQLALQKGGVDANTVNTRLGIALAKGGQKDAAKAAFQAVTGPRADLAAYWMLWLNQQA